ncbi:hypothetical protein DPMN_004831 [Dreissena polymorpha]|uniref:B box-type domain-containing protein n=1 Tax=Dreissena polymorpha TaxID=45954 RepID=A0A9D4MS21_DREPO|nr:hypothetical protein DPMN_004831 [Dreissena polymorpha]
MIIATSCREVIKEYRFILNIYTKRIKRATCSQSTVDKGSDSIIDFCCSPCIEHTIDQSAEFYCDNCLKFYCAECMTLHSQLFEKHVAYGRGDTSKWPVSKEVEDFLKNVTLMKTNI